jgi:hypothetical protein
LTEKEQRIIITEIIAGVCDYCKYICAKVTKHKNDVKEDQLGWGTLDYIVAAPNAVIVKESMFDEDDEIRVNEALEAAKEKGERRSNGAYHDQIAAGINEVRVCCIACFCFGYGTLLKHFIRFFDTL